MVERGAFRAPALAYSNRALAVNFLAHVKARLRGSATAEIEDLILSIIIEDQGGDLEELRKAPGIGVDVGYVPLPHPPFLPPALANDLRARMEAACRRSTPLPPEATRGLSGGVTHIFEVADLLREALQQSKLEPLHLLAAIVCVESSPAAQVLRDAGITRDGVLRAARG